MKILSLAFKHRITYASNCKSLFSKPLIKKFSSCSRVRDAFSPLDTFPRRHNGSSESDVKKMLDIVGVKDMEELASKTVPANILSKQSLALGKGLTENELLKKLKNIASKNKTHKTYIGMANASLLDEGTAAAEAMFIAYSAGKQKQHTFFVDKKCHPQTIACLQTRAECFKIKVVVGNALDYDFDQHGKDLFGILAQYPATDGTINDYTELANKIHSMGGQMICATDLLALTLLIPPGEWGADIAIGNSQRFGVPLGYGGPHAAFFACKKQHVRRIPGRLVGVSRDGSGNKAYRLSLQTREQHIRREKATSNICTAQALLANMAAMYGVYHGPEGVKNIAKRIHNFTNTLAADIKSHGYTIKTNHFFDTLNVHIEGGSKKIYEKALKAGINLRKVDDFTIGITLDETVTKNDLENLINVFAKDPSYVPNLVDIEKSNIPNRFLRTSPFMQHQVFNSYHSETEMLRYIYHLQSKDLSLAHSMISLGSCTMKLNATTEMIPVTWPEFANIHPFAPIDQAEGYKILIQHDLAEITGFDGISLQPNSGAQGEYAGLRVIGAYHKSRGDEKRDVCLIPDSAHGTNPASAAMSGMSVLNVKCNNGDLDMKDLEEKAKKYKDRLAAFMVTYPSTFGVFENGVVEACEIIHNYGGQVYMDGANMNAQIGLCKPADIGAD
ncbi:5565_t:CDS:2, partial [Racocetra fulgida]